MTRPKILAFVLLAAVIVFSLTWFGCSEKLDNLAGPQGASGVSGTAAPDPSRVQTVMAVQDRHSARLLAIEGVVGTATGLSSEGDVVVKVYTLRPGVPGIPESLEGVPVRVEISGEIHALAKPDKPGNGGGKDRDKTPSGKGRWDRPVPIGISVGNNRECVSGTIGCAVHKGGGRYILSNNHVLAMENDGKVGDPVVQPGRYDNKPPCANKVDEDLIASLSEWVDIKFDGSFNTMDAAIALSSETYLKCCTYTTTYGCPSSTPFPKEDVALGMAVQKVGRTTGHTEGEVSGVNGDFVVGYSSGYARYVDQIVVSGRKFLKSGDSGSLLVTVDDGNSPVGLLFAGNDSDLALANYIEPILTQFGVTVCDTDQ